MGVIVFGKKTRRYAYVITVFHVPTNTVTTDAGVINYAGSRHDVTMNRLHNVCKDYGFASEDSIIVHWSLELDDLL